MLKKLFFILLLVATSSCWRMPEEGEVSTLPNVNNPSLIHKPSSDMIPTPEVGY